MESDIRAHFFDITIAVIIRVINMRMDNNVSVGVTREVEIEKSCAKLNRDDIG